MKKSIGILLLVLLSASMAYGVDLTPDYAWGSYSDRTPYISPNPSDYEIAGGIQGEKYLFEAIYERENGGYYQGHKINARPYAWLEAESMYKEAHGINSQSLRAMYQPYKDVLYLDKISIGGSLNAIAWSNTRVLFLFNIRAKALMLSWETNFKDRFIVSYKAGFDIFGGGKKKGFITNMFRRYDRNNDSKFTQTKYEAGYLFKEKDDE